MKIEDAVNFARESGIWEYASTPEEKSEQYLRFAKLVEQATLERAAKVCDDARLAIFEYHEELIKSTGTNVCENLAYSIRALKDSND